MITLMIWITIVMVGLLVIGFAASRVQANEDNKRQLAEQKVKINYHSTTGTGSRR